MFALENRGETLIFMSRHFDETMIILISHFSPVFFFFFALEILTCDYFVLMINKIIYSKQKNWHFIYFSIFSSTFLQQFFPIHFVQDSVQIMAYG